VWPDSRLQLQDKDAVELAYEAHTALVRYMVPASQLLELDITSLTPDEAWDQLVKFLRPHVGRGDLRVPAGVCRTGDRLRRSTGNKTDTGTVPCKFPRMTRGADGFKVKKEIWPILERLNMNQRPTFQVGLGLDVLLPHCPLFRRRNLSAGKRMVAPPVVL